MSGARLRHIQLVILFAATMVMAAPACAQVDLSGQWGQRMHEDEPERGLDPKSGTTAACRSMTRRA